jgi:hypothetical protein
LRGEGKRNEKSGEMGWTKHCSGVLCLDNAFALSECHPPQSENQYRIFSHNA